MKMGPEKDKNANRGFFCKLKFRRLLFFPNIFHTFNFPRFYFSFILRVITGYILIRTHFFSGTFEKSSNQSRRLTEIRSFPQGLRTSVRHGNASQRRKLIFYEISLLPRLFLGFENQTRHCYQLSLQAPLNPFFTTFGPTNNRQATVFCVACLQTSGQIDVADLPMTSILAHEIRNSEP